MDPEQPITIDLIAQLAAELGLGETVPPRLLFRTLLWAHGQITTRDQALKSITNVLKGFMI